VTARRLADGVSAPARRRRPAKGAHPEAEGAGPADTPLPAAAEGDADPVQAS
jgi:tRNA (adenine57-N1/adenine58-N1)-methyltransferase